MTGVVLVRFQPPPADRALPLTAFLERAREIVAVRQDQLFRSAGVERIVTVREISESWGRALAGIVRALHATRLVIVGSGSVPRLLGSDARRLVAAASGDRRVALTNNRYSSDICAVPDAAPLEDLPDLPGDNALPRWLSEAAGFEIREMPAKNRLAYDLDSPLDVALLADTDRRAPAPLRALTLERGISMPRLDDLRRVVSDPRAELLVFGRSGSRTFAWLERHVACRVRFLAEERGLRASTPLAFGAQPGQPARASASTKPLPGRPPRATLGRMIERDGPGSLARIVGELADAAIIDTRVLLADRLGPDERSWPCAEDRFASDLLRTEAIDDAWLRELTASAASASMPILLGAHTLVGPGIPLALRGR